MSFDDRPAAAPDLGGADLRRLDFQHHRKERGDFGEDLAPEDGAEAVRYGVVGSPWPPRRKLLTSGGHG